jgi:SAM-dependent methyltransferase
VLTTKDTETHRRTDADHDPDRTDATESPALLSALRAAVLESRPVLGLDPASYARDHAAFEARSNQRDLIAGWLVERITRDRDDAPLSVLAVGCGDGTLDATVADVVARRSPARALRYVGIEPFGGSATQFAERMMRLEHSNLDSEVLVAPFGSAALHESFDVVTFVHSMYYVPDVGSTVLAAYALLAPGGELVVLSAPRGALNQLASVLAPPVEGHRQWFSDDVRDGFAATALDVDEAGSIDAVVDLTGADDDVLDFTVQAALTPALRTLVRAYLAEVSIVPGRIVVPHPVDAYVARKARIG